MYDVCEIKYLFGKKCHGKLYLNCTDLLLLPYVYNFVYAVYCINCVIVKHVLHYIMVYTEARRLKKTEQFKHLK